MPGKKPSGMTDNWKPKWFKNRADSLQTSGPGRYIALAMQFAIALALSLFLMIKLGGWLDAKAGTGIIFTGIGICFAVFSSLYIIVRQASQIPPPEKEEP